MSEHETPLPANQASPTPPAIPRRRAALSYVLPVCIALYGLSTLVVWAVLHFGGDRWWFATVMLFGPRWVYAIPWPILAVAAAVKQRLLLWPLAIAAIVLVGPIMGFQVPWHWSPAGGPTLRILSFNIDGTSVDSDTLMKLIQEVQPDVVALQEYRRAVGPAVDPKKGELTWPRGWHVSQYYEFLLASRFPITETKNFFRPDRFGELSAIRYTIVRNGQQVLIFNVHFQTPRAGLEALFDRKQDAEPSAREKLCQDIAFRSKESRVVSEWVSHSLWPTIVVGDFNMPSESTIFRRDWSDRRDAFSQSGLGFGYTKISRISGLTWGTRIDHILCDDNWDARRSWVGRDVGSDHLPLIAELK